MNGEQAKREMTPEEYTKAVLDLANAMFGIVQVMKPSPIVASDSSLEVLTRCIKTARLNGLILDPEKALSYYTTLIECAVHGIEDETQINEMLEERNNMIDESRNND
jgi:hypothetical protein